MRNSIWWRPFAPFILALMLLLSVSCARNDAAPLPAETLQAATAQAALFCNLRVDGRWIKTPSGQTVVLHGASVPTIAEMEASPTTPQAHLRDLAAAGASVVRLPVDEREVTPTFVPAKVGPFVDEANRLGIVVVLGWSGYRAGNIIVINNPDWMLATDAAIPPLADDNIVYGLNALPAENGYPLEQHPFMLTRWQADAATLPTQATELQRLNLGTIAPDAFTNELSEFWKANNTDLAPCQ
jgi:hypothetical protein